MLAASFTFGPEKAGFVARNIAWGTHRTCKVIREGMRLVPLGCATHTAESEEKGAAEDNNNLSTSLANNNSPEELEHVAANPQKYPLIVDCRPSSSRVKKVVFVCWIVLTGTDLTWLGQQAPHEA